MAQWPCPKLDRGEIMGIQDRFNAALKAWRLGGNSMNARLDDQFASLLSSNPKKPTSDLVQLSTSVYSAIDLRASTVSSIPIRLIQNTREGHQEVTNHPVLDLLKYVNPFWTFPRLMQSIEMSMCVYGQAFVVVERDNRGQPMELWFARADQMKVVNHPTEYISGFAYDTGFGQPIALDRQDVIWIRGVMDPKNEFRCLSPLEAARVSIESSLEAMNSNRAIFSNGLNPGGILSPKDQGVTLTKEQRQQIEEQLNLRLRGADKAHKLAVFSHPMQLDTPQLTPEDAQFMQLLGWTTLDVCRVFKVPPTKLMDFSSATYSNVEQADKAFFNDCIIPESRRIAAEFTEQLVSSYSQDLILEFDFSKIPSLQEDQTEIVSQMQALVNMGVPLNKVLAEYKPELLPPGQEGYSWGNEPAMQFGLDLGQPEPQPVQQSMSGSVKLKKKAIIPPFGSEAHKLAIRSRDRQTMKYEAQARKAIRQAQEQIKDRLIERIKQGSTKDVLGSDFGGLDSDDEAITIIRNAYEDAGLLAVVRDTTAAAGTRALAGLRLGIRFDLNHPAAERFLKDREQRFAEMIPEDQWAELKRVMTQAMESGAGTEGMIAAVRDSGVVSAARAEMVARTEIIGAYNGGLEAGWQQSGLEGQKVWIAALDQRTRETHMEAHGQMVGLDEEFEVGGVSTKGPGQTGVASEDINCRCSMDFIPG